MSLVGFEAQNHPQQIARNGARASIDDRGTTTEVFEPLNERFRFTIDAAASVSNAVLPRYWTLEDDALTQDWTAERVWCNPPYSSIKPWVSKAWESVAGGCQLVVMLLPANRTEQVWWQDYVEPYRDRTESRLRVEFLRGRMRFIVPPADRVLPNERPPFGCCLLIWEVV